MGLQELAESKQETTDGVSAVMLTGEGRGSRQVEHDVWTQSLLDRHEITVEVGADQAREQRLALP